MLNIPENYDKYTSPAKLMGISCQVSPCFTTRCVCWYLPKSSGARIRNDYKPEGDTQQTREYRQSMGHFATVTSSNKPIFPPALTIINLLSLAISA
jgi:hypothetical protein